METLTIAYECLIMFFCGLLVVGVLGAGWCVILFICHKFMEIIHEIERESTVA